MKKSEYKFIYKTIKPYLSKEIFGLIIVIIITFLSLLNPYITKQIIDVALGTKNLKSLYINIIFFIVVFLLSQGLSIIRSYTFTYISEKLSYDMRMELYRSIEHKSITFFNDKQVGELMVRILDEIQQVTNLFAGTMINIILQIATFVISLSFMVSMNILITVITICLIPVMFIILKYFNPKLKENNQKLMEQSSKLSDILQNNLYNIKIIKYMKAYKYGEKRFSNAMHHSIKLRYKGLFLNTMISVLISTLYAIPSTAVFLIGGYMVVDGKLSVGGVVALLSYVNKLFDPVMELASVNIELQHSIIAYRRYLELLDFNEQDISHRVSIDMLEKGIELKDLEFSYENGTPIINKLDMYIPLGSIVQLKGANGCGKSTLINLISGIIDTDKGIIKYDNIEIKNIRPTCFKKLLRIIPQNIYLFNDTIRNNIKMGRDIEDKKIIELSNELGCSDIISGIDLNLDTMILSGGNNVSGGQAQKVSLLRALIENSQILILDEASTFLDAHSKVLLEQYLEKNSENKIILLVSHDTNTSLKPNMFIDMENYNLAASFASN